jgi:hypothetical protein
MTTPPASSGDDADPAVLVLAFLPESAIFALWVKRKTSGVNLDRG